MRWTIAATCAALIAGVAVGQPVANPPVQAIDALNFELVGMATDETGRIDADGYGKLSPWPRTTDTTFYSGCYPPADLDKVHSPAAQCFMTIDIHDPAKPKRLATVYTFDPAASPQPPRDHLIWKPNYPFPNLPVSTACKVNWADPDIASGRRPAPCWDPGWNTHTHYTAIGPNHVLAVNQERYRYGTDRQANYRGVKFYDVADPAHPRFLSYWEAPASNPIPQTGVLTDAQGVHHFTWKGNLLYIGSEYKGFVGRILVTLDASDPKAPKEINKWWIPGQRTPEEDGKRDWVQADTVRLFNSPAVKRPDGKVVRYVAEHYVSFDGDLAFVSYHQGGLVILDTKDPRRPKMLSWLDYIRPGGDPGNPAVAACRKSAGGEEAACGSSHSARIIPGTKTLVMSDEYFSCPYGHVRFLDVADPRKPKILSHFMTDQNMTCDPKAPNLPVDRVRFPRRDRGPSSHLGNVLSDKVYLMAWYGMGVVAIDYSDLAHPKEVGHFRYKAGDAFGVTDPAYAYTDSYDVIIGPGDLLYVPDSTAGLRVLRYTGPR